MLNDLEVSANRSSAPDFRRQQSWPSPARGRDVAPTISLRPELPSDTAFLELQVAYRPTRGLARGDELAARLHVDGTGGHARLARWIVGRQVFSFAWNDDFWLPMFQFNTLDYSLHSGMRPLLGELADVMDGWAIAAWFVQPSDFLGGQSPVQAWRDRGPDVYQAARLQRFVVTG